MSKSGYILVGDFAPFRAGPLHSLKISAHFGSLLQNPSHLAFPLFPEFDRRPRSPGFDGELMTGFLEGVLLLSKPLSGLLAAS
jgi:hypothetical protein